MSAILELLGKLLDMSKALPGARRDKKRKATLGMLLADDPKIKWRSISTLASAIGTSEEKTKELLTEIGARGSTGQDKDMWGLRSRVDAAAGAESAPDR